MFVHIHNFTRTGLGVHKTLLLNFDTCTDAKWRRFSIQYKKSQFLCHVHPRKYGELHRSINVARIILVYILISIVIYDITFEWITIFLCYQSNQIVQVQYVFISIHDDFCGINRRTLNILTYWTRSSFSLWYLLFFHSYDLTTVHYKDKAFLIFT